MQAISLMSLAAGQAAPAPAQGGSQTATVPNAGLFQGMLLEVLLGGAITPELAAQLQTAPQPTAAANGQATTRAPEGGQSPKVLVSGPGAGGIAPAQPAPAVEAGAAVDTVVAAPVVAPNPPENEPADPPAQPAAPKAKDAPPAQESIAPDAVVAQVLMQAQTVVQQAAAPQPAAPDPQTGAPAVVVAEVAADPQLEAFVQRAVKAAQGEQPEAPVAEGKTPAGPTFQDLVKLVAGADQAGGPQPEGQAKPQAQAQTQTQAQSPTPVPSKPQSPAPVQAAAQAKAPTETEARTEPQTQNQVQTRPQAPQPAPQAAPERHEPDPAPVKAPKAPESPEKTADVPVTQAPRPAVHEAATAAPDAPQAAPRQPVDPEQVLRQVSRFVKVMVDSKQSEVRLQLHPENLGSVGVRLVLGDGALKANLVAQDAAVKAALEANLDQLKSRLTDQGFQVEQVHVTVGGGDGFGQPQHSRQGEQRPPQQPWRSQPWLNQKNDESNPVPYQQRTTPTWFVQGKGARINSLA